MITINTTTNDPVADTTMDSSRGDSVESSVGTSIESRINQVKGLLQEIDGQISEIRDKIEPLEQKLASLHKQRRALTEVLNVMDPESSPPQSQPLHNREPVRERVRRETAQILSAHGRPMHIQDIITEFKRQGFILPGKGKVANITVHLSGDNDFYSPKRGFWALRKGKKASSVDADK